MNWQLYWPNWWKLWPYYRKSFNMQDDDSHIIYNNVFAFGPFQVFWFSS